MGPRIPLRGIDLISMRWCSFQSPVRLARYTGFRASHLRPVIDRADAAADGRGGVDGVVDE